MRILLFIAALLAVSVGHIPDSEAQRGRGQDRARDAMRSGEIRPLDEILATVTSRYPGRVLDVDLQRGRQWVYRVKLLGHDGRVRYVFVDARTNRILSVQGGR